MIAIKDMKMPNKLAEQKELKLWQIKKKEFVFAN